MTELSTIYSLDDVIKLNKLLDLQIKMQNDALKKLDK
jgi:hypothetical protein